MKMSLEKVDINFQCESCDNTATCNVTEAAFNGVPMCIDCDEEMEIIDCEIDCLDL